MKRLSKWSILTIVLVIVLLGTGCGKKQEKNLDRTVYELMNELYEKTDLNITDLIEIELTKENQFYYLGVEELDYKEGLASEAMTSAHSIVLVRMEKGANIEKAKKVIQDNVNPKKWISMEVEKDHIIVDSIGDIIIVIMDNEYAEKIENSFKSLKE